MYRVHIFSLRNLLGLFFSAFFLFPLLVSAQATTTAEQTPPPIGSTVPNGIDQIAIDRTTSLLNTLTNLSESSISDYLEVSISPANPGPNEIISVSIKSYLTDLNKASIKWLLNGSISLSGTGKTSFSFQNGQSEKTTTLSIVIVTSTGETVTKEYSWTPVGITLLWEADTYTPPFYRGKALLSPQSKTTLVAIPDRTGTQNALGAGNFVYTWEKGGSVVSTASGYAKNLFTFVGPKPYEEMNVRVTASSLDNSINSQATTYLKASSPYILFYQNDPLLGTLYNHPVFNSYNLGTQEFSLQASPYFFSNDQVGDLTPALSYTWSVNGSTVQNSGKEITLRNDTGAQGTSLISLAIRGLSKTYQSASRDLLVNFLGSDNSSRPTF